MGVGRYSEGVVLVREEDVNSDGCQGSQELLACEGTLIHEDKVVGEDYPIPVLCWWWLPRNVDSSTLNFQNANC